MALEKKADKLAKLATSLPKPNPQTPTDPWDIITDGLPQLPPHKTGTEHLIPLHSHSNIHPISFHPLKNDNQHWFRWLFALQWREGFDPYQTFWQNSPASEPCPLCTSHHNFSVHGCLALYPKSPLHLAWHKAWNHPLPIQWLQQCPPEDTFLIGKVCIPTSLHSYLRQRLDRKATRKLIFQFQHAILPLLTEALDILAPIPPDWTPKKRRIFVQDDWIT